LRDLVVERVRAKPARKTHPVGPLVQLTLEPGEPDQQIIALRDGSGQLGPDVIQPPGLASALHPAAVGCHGAETR
jgi:hypothetical protein